MVNPLGNVPLELYNVSGPEDYLVPVAVGNNTELQTLIIGKLLTLPPSRVLPHPSNLRGVPGRSAAAPPGDRLGRLTRL